MHNNMFFLSIIFLLASCSTDSQKDNETPEIATISKSENNKPLIKGDFIGYKNGLPTFSSLDSGRIYQINTEGETVLISKITGNNKAIFINDSAIIYQDKKSKEIVIKYNKYSITTPYDKFINSLSATSKADTILFFDESQKSNLKMLIPTEKRIEQLVLQGEYVKFSKNLLFYSSYFDEEDSETLSVLFKSNLINLNQVTKLIEKIHEEWYSSPDGRYIACLISKDASWVNGILNVETGKVKTFDLQGVYSQAYFSSRYNGFIYYKQGDILDDTIITVK